MIAAFAERTVFERALNCRILFPFHNASVIRHCQQFRQSQIHPRLQRHYARMLSHPPQAEYTFGLSWQIIAPLLLLGTGSIAMAIWYFSSNEFLDAGFPPRAAEAFRIASLSDDDWQLRHSIRYWRTGLEIALTHGMSPFDERIMKIKGRMMQTIKRDGDIGAEREVLEEIRRQALEEIQGGNVKDRGKLVAYAVQASIGLANVTLFRIQLTVDPSSWSRRCERRGGKGGGGGRG